MNIVLFEAEELGRVLRADDPRAVHLKEVLRRGVGETFDAGVVNGRKGKGRICALRAEGVEWEFAVGNREEPELDPIELVVGLPRPQTARKILQEAAAMGVRAMWFVVTDKAEAGYARSTLWTSGEWKRHVRAGVEQAFTTRLPRVEFGLSLAEAMERAPGGARVALDNYEAPQALSSTEVALAAPATLIVGAERGWSAEERNLLRASGAQFAHLGTRVLRTETACVAALAILKARLGVWR